MILESLQMYASDFISCYKMQLTFCTWQSYEQLIFIFNSSALLSSSLILCRRSFSFAKNESRDFSLKFIWPCITDGSESTLCSLITRALTRNQCVSQRLFTSSPLIISIRHAASLLLPQGSEWDLMPFRETLIPLVMALCPIISSSFFSAVFNAFSFSSMSHKFSFSDSYSDNVFL